MYNMHSVYRNKTEHSVEVSRSWANNMHELTKNNSKRSVFSKTNCVCYACCRMNEGILYFPWWFQFSVSLIRSFIVFQHSVFFNELLLKHIFDMIWVMFFYSLKFRILKQKLNDNGDGDVDDSSLFSVFWFFNIDEKGYFI